MKKAHLFITISIILLIALTAAGCGSTSQGSTPSSNGGSNITIVGSTSVGPYIDALAKLYMNNNPGVTINVQQVGSGQGISNTIDGTADIGMSSRELKESEKPLVEYPMCKDGIAVVVQKDNPVKGLTLSQIKDIYTGKIKNWSEVGGNDGQINLYTRESTSGTRGGFEELVLGKDAAGKQVTIDEKICAAVLNSTGDLAAAVGKDKNAIGYISLGIVPNYAEDRALDVDGAAASVSNVANETYKLQRNYLLLTKTEPSGKIKEFIDYVLASEEAKDYYTKNGLVPIAK